MRKTKFAQFRSIRKLGACANGRELQYRILERAGYGKQIVKQLSDVLQKEFGDGFSRRQLELMRQLYLVFPIANALSSQLTWTHYKHLIRLDDADKRAFYAAEATKNAWTVRDLERQIHSLLYERLLMSQDKESVLAIAQGTRNPTEAFQIIKDPTVLEFLGLKPQPKSKHWRSHLPLRHRAEQK